MDKENGNRKRSTKGNTRKYEEEGKSKIDNEEGKGKGIKLECKGFKKTRRRILRLCETIWDSGSDRDMGRGTDLEKI
jgi:hypothetical protein